MFNATRQVAFASALVSIGFFASTAQAQTILTGHTTAGSDMSGAKITASFLDGSSETLTWGLIKNEEAGKGGVFSSRGWSLMQAGDSFINPWMLQADQSISLASLTIDLFGGNAVFDTVADETLDSNTPGSIRGLPFKVTSGLRPDNVDYSTPIDISNGDLFSTLSLSWSNGFSNSLLSFLADTDSGTPENPVTLLEEELLEEELTPDPVNETPIPEIIVPEIIVPEIIVPEIIVPEIIEAPPLVTVIDAPPLPTRVPEPSALMALLAIAGLARGLKRSNPAA